MTTALDLTNRLKVLEYLTSQLPSEDPTALAALLDASAASNCGDPPVITYRPWWVHANFLQSDPRARQRVKSAAGSEVQYRDPSTAVQALMRRQAALDQALCNIPAGFEAADPSGAGSASLQRVYQ